VTIAPWVLTAGAIAIAIIYRGEAARWRALAERAACALNDVVVQRRDSRGRFVASTNKDLT
jgi:hypothetical protein